MNTSLLQQIDKPRDAASDETTETILACCYRIARERARAIRIQLVETRERDERETKASNDDDAEK